MKPELESLKFPKSDLNPLISDLKPSEFFECFKFLKSLKTGLKSLKPLNPT